MGIFNKLFRKNQNTNQVNFTTNTKINDVLKERQNSINIGQSIYPVIKRTNDPILNLVPNDKIILNDFLNGLALCYRLDLGDKFEMIQESFLIETGLTKDDLFQASQRNLLNKTQSGFQIIQIDLSEEVEGSKPFYKISFDNDFNTSTIILEELWELKIKEILNSNRIAISIPTNDTLYFSDMRIGESFGPMKSIASHDYDIAKNTGNHLSKNTFIRKDGKWILFQETDEHYNQLML